MRKRKPDPPALEVTRKERGCVVTARRARWKEAHTDPSDKVIRLVRFVWMREELTIEDRYKLNGTVLGTAMRQGLIAFAYPYNRISVTARGRMLLKIDRERHR